jgi:hypothetical protein
VAIIFGLSVSTFLTLVIVPTFYALLDEWMLKLKAATQKLPWRTRPVTEPAA